jgi:transcriptional regulator with XRE-family HTH domain
MGDRDEVQVARWSAIRERVGACLRELRVDLGLTSQARLSGDLEDLGYHVTQSMISRYEQGLLEAPLTLERLVGWALCCASLSAPAFRELLELAGYYLPWSQDDLARFDTMLRHFRALPLPDQIVFRRKLLWHVLGLRAASDWH